MKRGRRRRRMKREEEGEEERVDPITSGSMCANKQPTRAYLMWSRALKGPP